MSYFFALRNVLALRTAPRNLWGSLALLFIPTALRVLINCLKLLLVSTDVDDIDCGVIRSMRQWMSLRLPRLRQRQILRLGQ